jgi:hypothetical protein
MEDDAMGDESLVELAKEVGRISGQVRELIHKDNNRQQRDEAIAVALIRLEGVPKQIEDMRNILEERLQKLEVEAVRRDQTASLGRLILKSPMVAWLITGLAFVVSLVKGWISFNG